MSEAPLLIKGNEEAYVARSFIFSPTPIKRSITSCYESPNEKPCLIRSFSGGNAPPFAVESQSRESVSTPTAKSSAFKVKIPSSLESRYKPENEIKLFPITKFQEPHVDYAKIDFTNQNSILQHISPYESYFDLFKMSASGANPNSAPNMNLESLSSQKAAGPSTQAKVSSESEPVCIINDCIKITRENLLAKQHLCNCKRTKCLKLYCECFSAGEMCSQQCNCVGCNNNQHHFKVRNEVIESILERDPEAFNLKLRKYSKSSMTAAVHKKGCNCKKSSCLKKYCECFNLGIGCSELCKCEDCKNSGESLRKGSKEGISESTDSEEGMPTFSAIKKLKKDSDEVDFDSIKSKVAI